MGDVMTETVKKYFTVGNTILLLGILVSQVRWQTKVDSRLQMLESHAYDKVVHMPLKEKYDVFVPRVEIDSRLSNIEYAIKELSSDIKKNFDN